MTELKAHVSGDDCARALRPNTSIGGRRAKCLKSSWGCCAACRKLHATLLRALPLRPQNSTKLLPKTATHEYIFLRMYARVMSFSWHARSCTHRSSRRVMSETFFFRFRMCGLYFTKRIRRCVEHRKTCSLVLKNYSSRRHASRKHCCKQRRSFADEIRE